jgi:hypothetical protein
MSFSKGHRPHLLFGTHIAVPVKCKSHAQWPKGTIGLDGGINGNDQSEDTHESREAAEAVCNLLHRNGFGGDRQIFPLRTWVTEE